MKLSVLTASFPFSSALFLSRYFRRLLKSCRFECPRPRTELLFYKAYRIPVKITAFGQSAKLAVFLSENIQSISSFVRIFHNITIKKAFSARMQRKHNRLLHSKAKLCRKEAQSTPLHKKSAALLHRPSLHNLKCGSILTYGTRPITVMTVVPDLHRIPNYLSVCSRRHVRLCSVTSSTNTWQYLTCRQAQIPQNAHR